MMWLKDGNPLVLDIIKYLNLDFPTQPFLLQYLKVVTRIYNWIIQIL